MCFSSDEYSDSLSECCFKLFIKLVDADSVHEVMDRVIIWFAFENYSNIKGHKDIIISWACSYWEFVCDVLLSHKELNSGPWQAEDETTLLLDVVEFAMLGDDCISTLGTRFENRNVKFS